MSRSILTGFLITVLAGCAEETVLMREMYLVSVAEGERYLGGGCAGVNDGAESTVGFGGQDVVGYSVSHRFRDNGVEVVVQAEDGKVLHTETYDEAFLKSGQVDEVVVELSEDQSVRLRYWGGPTCEPVRELDTE